MVWFIWYVCFDYTEWWFVSGEKIYLTVSSLSILIFNYQSKVSPNPKHTFNVIDSDQKKHLQFLNLYFFNLEIIYSQGLSKNNMV